MSDFTLRELLGELAEQRGLDLRGYKISTLERRFRYRLSQLHIRSYADYRSYLHQHPEELNQLLNTVLINVSEFLRDPPMWAVLREELLPQLTASMKPGDTFRVWSAGCATGEEAYSLAILLNEHFGSGYLDYDIKIYATDVDAEALATARRGEYAVDRIRNVADVWRTKYFEDGGKTYRIKRELRRRIIFGRSNLVSDAPISKVRLLLCRNMLIYFGVELQRHILARLHFATQPDGILVLGRSESQLAGSKMFRPVVPRWRIFQALPVHPHERSGFARFVPPPEEATTLATVRRDYSLLKLYHDTILDTLEPAVILLNANDEIVTQNPAAAKLWGLGEQQVVGANIADTVLMTRCPELRAKLAESKKTGTAVQFSCPIPGDKEEPRVLVITLRAVANPTMARVGTIIYADDASPRQLLQRTMEDLQTTGEELQSSNEELEATNEELQSANEELEATNEELQSTNEELETTNEELHALNEELGTANEELEARSRELDEVNTRHAETLDRLPWPVLVVDNKSGVQFWNTASERTFGLAARSVLGLELAQLPFPEALRNLLARRGREVAQQSKPRIERNFYVQSGAFQGPVDIHMTPLAGSQGVLVILETFPSGALAKQRNQANRQADSKKKKKTLARNASSKKGAKRSAPSRPKKRRR